MRSSHVSRLQLNSTSTASEQLPYCNSTVAMPQVKSDRLLSCSCSQILSQTFQSDFAVRPPERTSTRSVADATRTSSAVVMYFEDKIKTSGAWA
jgi:hypothetical protein